ncbi:putative penicillin amidase [Bradyrhizobium oligotrophicum S58]|uniref:Putative penicillin amidase n=1 Tax=Bradyrhizobium oligotrophicum S58 TaxID=1245469 RepID=M4Z3Z8_9BRAD|nr:putative penicillin amidase [Bradyrhizobium oligotrophicum S58]
MPRLDQPLLLRFVYRDGDALSDQRTPVGIGGDVDPHGQIGIDGRRVGSSEPFDGKPHGTVRIEGILGDARQFIQFVLVKDEAVPSIKLMIRQAFDHASVVQNDLGQIAKNVLQQADRRLRPMDSVHRASPVSEASKRSNRFIPGSRF